MGNNKRATCFATLLQNESAIRDMLRVLLPTFEPVRWQVFFVTVKPRNIAIQLVMQQCCEKSCRFFVACFTEPSIKIAQSKTKISSPEFL